MGKHFSWTKGFNAPLLLAKYRKIRTTPDGKAQLDAIKNDFWLPVLNSAIKSPPSIQPMQLSCIQDVLFDATSLLTDPDSFLEQLEKALIARLKRTQKKYFLLCSVTYEGPKLISRLRDGDCILHWKPSASLKRYRKSLRERKKIGPILERYHIDDVQTGMTHLMVDVTASSHHEAFEKAINCVDRFRGLVNLLGNTTRRLKFLPSAPHAVNRLRRGPFSTVHKADGTIADEIFWYENRWWHSRGPFRFKNTEQDLQKHFSKWWKKATKGPLNELIGAGLLRYCNALDDHNMDVCLTRLWSALELLTGTTNTRYDVTVSRITRLFTDFEDARLIAEHVRCQRNATIHAAASPDEQLLDSTIHHAELLCNRILKFCILEGHQFKGPSEVYEFLDSPTDLARIRRSNRISAAYLRYRKRFSTPEKAPPLGPPSVILSRS